MSRLNKKKLERAMLEKRKWANNNNKRDELSAVHCVGTQRVGAFD